MTDMQLRTDRVGVLLDQFTTSCEIARERLEGLTDGERRHPPERLVDFSPTAAGALSQLWEQTERWAASLAAMTDEQLDRPGYGQYPYGLDPELPFIGIIWWTNRELIHHLAEAALLRDLWRAGRGRSLTG